MNRGSGGILVSVNRRPDSFNEAPIHESGKCGASARRWAGAICFNEAPIHESGKSFAVRP